MAVLITLAVLSLIDEDPYCLPLSRDLQTLPAGHIYICTTGKLDDEPSSKGRADMSKPTPKEKLLEQVCNGTYGSIPIQITTGTV